MIQKNTIYILFTSKSSFPGIVPPILTYKDDMKWGKTGSRSAKLYVSFTTINFSHIFHKRNFGLVLMKLLNICLNEF